MGENLLRDGGVRRLASPPHVRPCFSTYVLNFKSVISESIGRTFEPSLFGLFRPEFNKLE